MTRKDLDDLDRDLCCILLFPVVASVVAILAFVIWFGFFHEPPKTVETTGIVTSVTIKKNSGSGNGKYKDKLYVWFHNGLCYSKSFNRRDGAPAEYKSFVVDQKYKLWHREGWSNIIGYQRFQE